LQFSHSTSASKSGVAVEEVPNSNPPFSHKDFELVCSYLEDNINFKQLYESGSKTKVGAPVLTKTAEYETFAIYMNDHSNKRFHLTGKQLCQRVDHFK